MVWGGMLCGVWGGMMCSVGGMMCGVGGHDVVWGGHDVCVGGVMCSATCMCGLLLRSSGITVHILQALLDEYCSVSQYKHCIPHSGSKYSVR